MLTSSERTGRARTRRSAAPARGADALATDVLRLRIGAGAPPDLRGVSDRCRRALAVAAEVGAPFLEAMDGAAAAEEDHRRAQRAVAVASAQTRAVAAGLLAAPLLLVPGLGRLVSADLVGFYGSAPGLLVLVVGGVLLLAGALIIWRLVGRVGRAAGGDRATRATGRGPAGAAAAAAAAALAWRTIGPAVAPLAALVAHHLMTRTPTATEPTHGVDEAADLVATGLSGGVPVPQALRLAAHQLPALAVPLRQMAFDLELGASATGGSRSAPRSGGTDGSGDPRRSGRRAEAATPLLRLRAVLTTATDVGAPVVPTLRRLATELRADDLARVLAAAERLPAQLTFPTALCLLPATVLLVGAPIVHAGLVAAGT